MTYLAVRRKVAASTQNQALKALVFMYGQVLGRELRELGKFARAHRPERIQVVLSREEVRALLGKLAGTQQLIGRFLYGTGLRLLEVRVAFFWDLPLIHDTTKLKRDVKTRRCSAVRLM